MPVDTIALAAFTPDHLDRAVELSRQVKWPHRRDDWATVLALGTGIVALDGGRVVGTAMVTRYGREVATISLVIVDAGMRGRGIGRKLMDWALRAAGDREYRLIATPDGLPLYRRLGFRPVEKILQYQAKLGALPPGEAIVWADPDRLAEIVALDCAAFGTERGALLEALFQRGRIAVPRQGAGFAVLRPFGRGEVAGPVVADTLQTAQALLAALFAFRPGAFMRVDTGETSGLAPWLAAHGLEHVDTEIAMHRGPATQPQAGRVRTFALAGHAHH